MTRFRAGLIGSGIQASLTPAMHEAEGAAKGHDYRYDLIDTDRRPEPLADLLDWAQSEGFSGLNITHPYKQAVMPLLDRLDPDAEALGAVNTVVLHDGLRIGHNTDWSGFAEGLRRAQPNAPLGAVVQLGAGGAGSAVAYALLKRGARRLTIFDNDAAKAVDLAARMAALFPSVEAVVGRDLSSATANADGLVNCTPVGMAKYPGAPLPLEYLRPSLWVADVVYFPLETALLAAARAKGCAVVDGGGMAVFQAVEAFRLITGLTPDSERMIASFKRLLSR